MAVGPLLLEWNNCHSEHSGHWNAWGAHHSNKIGSFKNYKSYSVDSYTKVSQRLGWTFWYMVCMCSFQIVAVMTSCSLQKIRLFLPSNSLQHNFRNSLKFQQLFELLSILQFWQHIHQLLEKCSQKSDNSYSVWTKFVWFILLEKGPFVWRLFLPLNSVQEFVSDF